MSELIELGILGGAKAFAEPLHVGRPNLGDQATFISRVQDIVNRRWFSNAGRYVKEFEERVARISGTKHCIACCNGTVALEIAARAMGLRGEVLVPAFTFVATPHSLQWQEITPAFVDVSARDHNLDPAQLERHITPRTTGILGVHLWGRACDTTAISAIADKHGLQVLYDASHAFGCEHLGRPIGTFGRASVFSFHATKFIHALEGGAIVTDDDELANKARLMKNFGFRGYDDVAHVGTNGKMNEISAAMGLTNLEAMSEMVAVNRRNYEAYRRELSGVPGLQVVAFEPRGAFNYQYVIVEVDAACALSRDQLVAVLWADNVLARRYFYPGCHRMEPYRSLFPNAHLWLQQTEGLSERVMALPTGQAVTSEMITQIGALVRAAIERAPEIREFMRTHGAPTKR